MSDQQNNTIIVLNDYCYVNGGASKMAIDEAISLADSGQNVIFIGAVGPICDALSNAPMEVVCLDQVELADAGKNIKVILQGIWNVPAYKAMRDVLARCDASSTLVHLHGYTKALTTSPVRCAVKRGFKVICTLHDFFPACPNGGYFDYQQNAPCERKCLSMACITAQCDKRNYGHKLFRVVRAWGQKYLGLFPSRVKHYITLSKNSAAILKPYIAKDAKYYPLENLIEVQKQPAIDAAKNTEIVMVGRLDPEKGVELMLRAVKAAGVSMTFVGDGPLREIAEQEENVTVTGWVDGTQVIKHLSTARCLVFPSLWYETYGLVVSEAISQGIPVIVSDVTAAAERIENNVHGWHFESGNENDLKRCLEITKDNLAISNAGASAYQMFWQNPPTRENHVHDLMKIYQSILA